MASNQLSSEERDKINTDIDTVLGRAVAYYKFPLKTYNDKLALARACFSASIRRGLEEITPTAEGRLVQWQAFSRVTVDKSGTVVMWARDTPEGEEAFGGVLHSSHITWDDVAAVLPAAKMNALLNWFSEASQVHNTLLAAKTTFDEVLEMVSTPGQLRRMIPDLLPSLSVPVQRMLTHQKRASSMPYAWAAFPRIRVEAATEALAMCKLLPESDITWGDFSRQKVSWFCSAR